MANNGWMRGFNFQGRPKDDPRPDSVRAIRHAEQVQAKYVHRCRICERPSKLPLCYRHNRSRTARAALGQV